MKKLMQRPHIPKIKKITPKIIKEEVDIFLLMSVAVRPHCKC